MMNKSEKNHQLDEMGQVSSKINQTDQVISPDNSIGVKTPGLNVPIPFKAGEGINIGDYQTRISGSYTPGKQLQLRTK
jgi:hypothetical protein